MLRTDEGTSEARHEWLEAAVRHLRPRFTRAGYGIPERIRVSIGFTRGSGWQHSIGQCWAADRSSDQFFEVFVSPELGTPEHTTRILGVLTHELVHATVGVQAGHKAPFKRCANAVGLAGRMTATTESDAFAAWVNDVVVADIGRYPAGKLRLTYRKQTTRLVKCVCATCQYPARTTRVWLDASGPPHCPEHRAMEEVT